jgi:hypothetical protein
VSSLAECAKRGVEERIRLEHPAFGNPESGRAQEATPFRGAGQRQLDLDFAWRTRTSYNFLPKIA